MDNNCRFILKILLVTLVLIFSNLQSISQEKKSKDTNLTKIEKLSVNDSDEINAIENLEKIFVGEIIRQNNEKRIKRLREEQLNRVYSKIDEIRSYISKGIDTSEYYYLIRLAESGYQITSDILVNDDVNITTPRNLTTSLLLNKELLNDLELISAKIKLRISEVTAHRKNLDSLASDTIIFKIPKDTSEIAEYFKMLAALGQAYNPVDSMLINSLSELNIIQNRINDISTKLNESIWRIESIRATDELSFFSGGFLKKNYPFIWDNSVQHKSFSEAVKYSTAKNLRVLMFYIVNNLFTFLILILFALVIYYAIRKFRSKIVTEKLLSSKFGISVFVTKPFWTALFLSFSVLQFILPRPPLVFSGILWILTGFILLILINKRKDRNISLVWLCILIIYILIFNSNLLLIVTTAERWALLIISLVSLISLFYIKKSAADFIADKRWMKTILFICLIVFAVSIITNITGYFNLTKQIVISTLLTMYLSILFYAVYTYLNEALIILAEFSEENSDNSFTRNMQNLKRSFPKAAKYLLAAGVIMLISRNFYLYDYFAEGLSIFLGTTRTLGDFTFKIENILLFIVITVISAVISKFISLYSELKSAGLFSGKDERGGIGNWLLLIRISVFSAGLLIAFVSSGFPMDKLTIIIGSLGVGIGLGLQSIVGNLFSGVFLAFEKPVKIGDQIEVDGKTGIIKEIGIRSSKLETFEGSDVIIPNGDLLSKHVINWTRKNNKRRAEIFISVKEPGDINKYKSLILKLLDENNNVEKLPPPQVLVNSIKGPEAEFRILFWGDVNDYLQIKSEVYYTIQNVLRAEEDKLKESISAKYKTEENKTEENKKEN